MLIDARARGGTVRAALAIASLLACEARKAPVEIEAPRAAPAPVHVDDRGSAAIPATAEAEKAVAGAPRSAPAVALHRPVDSDDPFHWRIDVVREGSGFRVARALRVAGEPPKNRRGPRGRAWRYRALSAGGAVLVEGDLADPTDLRGEFDSEGGIDSFHGKHTQPVTFSIRVPRVPAATIEFRTSDDATPLGSVPFPREAP